MSRPPVCWIFAAAPAVSRRHCRCTCPVSPVPCWNFAGSNGYLRQNLKRHAPQLECIAGDVLHPPAELLHRQFHIITCNPPYLTAADMEQLQPEVAREPETALFGGTDGLDFYRKLTPLWKPALQPAGWLVYEVGAGQAPDVEAILQENGYARYTPSPTSQASDALCWDSGRNFGICSGAIGNTIDRKERIHSLYQIKDDNLWQKQI